MPEERVGRALPRRHVVKSADQVEFENLMLILARVRYVQRPVDMLDPADVYARQRAESLVDQQNVLVGVISRRARRRPVAPPSRLHAGHVDERHPPASVVVPLVGPAVPTDQDEPPRAIIDVERGDALPGASTSSFDRPPRPTGSHPTLSSPHLRRRRSLGWPRRPTQIGSGRDPPPMSR